jgi:Tol biopolymer transport system component
MYPQSRRIVRQVVALGLLVALIALALNACGAGGQEASKKSATGDGPAATNGQIVFRRYFNADQTKGALFTMNPDGSHIRQITHPPNGWRDDDPVWSPDGQSIVFNREKIDTSTSRLGLVNPDTTDTREITQCTGRCVYDFNPTYSPDGRSIVFHRTVGPFVPKGEPRKTPVWKLYAAIFISGLDGSDPRQVTETPERRPGFMAEVNEPAISPDGKMLGFVRTRFEPEENTAVFVQPIDSPGDAQQLTPWKMNCQERPEFSPDGELMLFRCLPEGEEGPSNLYWVHPDGTGLHPLTNEEDGDKQYLGSSFAPSFSEGEGWITVGRTGGYGDEGNADVFRILIEEGEVLREVNLTRSGKWESNPNWGSHPPLE